MIDLKNIIRVADFQWALRNEDINNKDRDTSFVQRINPWVVKRSAGMEDEVNLSQESPYSQIARVGIFARAYFRVAFSVKNCFFLWTKDSC